MNLVRRSIRNLIRSPLRTGGIIAILAVSLGLALIMLTVNGASENQLNSIGEEIGTDITIRAAGSFGAMGGGEPLNVTDIDKINDIPHVVSVQKTVQTRLTGSTLQSSIDAGTLGRRQGGVGGGGGFGGSAPSSFTMPITTMGIDPATADLVLMGDAKMTMVDGRYFAQDEIDADVAVVGDALAAKNGLAIGSMVEIEGVSVEVIGIFDTSQVFGDGIIVMPIETVQRVFSLDGVTSVTVVADYVDNVDGVVTAIRGIFDENTADVVTASGQYDQISKSVSNAGSTSRIGMIAAFIVAAVVILFSLVLMVRQRVKEIGILKAIGASNLRIGFQFGAESLFMSLMAAIIGAIVTYPLAQKVADLLVSDPATTETAVGGFARNGGGFGGGGGFVPPSGGFLGGGGVTSFGGLDVAVSPEVFLYAFAIAIGLAVIASVFPSWYISRIKPAEVLRND